MGNLCSKSSNEADHFSTPGRVLGTASSQPRGGGQSTAPVPSRVTSTPGRTLGGKRDGASSPDDARRAAAQAAEV